MPGGGLVCHRVVAFVAMGVASPDEKRAKLGREGNGQRMDLRGSARIGKQGRDMRPPGFSVTGLPQPNRVKSQSHYMNANCTYPEMKN